MAHGRIQETHLSHMLSSPTLIISQHVIDNLLGTPDDSMPFQALRGRTMRKVIGGTPSGKNAGGMEDFLNDYLKVGGTAVD